MTTAVDLYGAGLQAAHEPMLLRYADGTTRTQPVGVWTAEEHAGDESLLDRCTGATLDIGCGPGRLTVALGLRGLPALGIDIAPAAVRLARSRGALVLARSAFDTLPGVGRWRTVLLADGNLGIGGDPAGLLRRLRELLAPGCSVLTELDPPGTPSGPARVRVEHAGLVSDWFRWAHVAADDANDLARAAELALTEQWEAGGRWFAALSRP